MLEIKRILQTMPPEEIDKLAAQLDRIHSMLGIARVVGGMVVASVGGLIAVVVWVNSTTITLAATQKDVRTLEIQRAEALKEWGVWRVQKDETDTRMLQILESQSRMLDRQQVILDRVSLKN